MARMTFIAVILAALGMTAWSPQILAAGDCDLFGKTNKKSDFKCDGDKGGKLDDNTQVTSNKNWRKTCSLICAGEPLYDSCRNTFSNLPTPKRQYCVSYIGTAPNSRCKTRSVSGEKLRQRVAEAEAFMAQLDRMKKADIIPARKAFERMLAALSIGLDAGKLALDVGCQEEIKSNLMFAYCEEVGRETSEGRMYFQCHNNLRKYQARALKAFATSYVPELGKSLLSRLLGIEIN